MDKITESFVREFVKSRELSRLPEADQFEAFAAYCVVAKEYDDDFDPNNLRTGGGNDLGIDALALIVNGDLVDHEEEILDLRTRNNYLQARIVVVQAKRSSEFSSSVVTELADGLCDFFSDAPRLPQSDNIKERKKLVDELYSHSTAFRRGSPDLVVRYVTTGTWTNDVHLSGKVTAAQQRLEGLNLFNSVSFQCLGAREVQGLYRNAENSVEAAFEFPNAVVLPNIEGVEQAYIGIVAASEYLKLITDAAGNIRRSLFYDNVRDFQDYNEVNRGIRKTVSNADQRGRFVVLNNGVTIVARELTTTRNTYVLRDYQVVNGCQTSHVLFDESEHIADDLFVPLKVVVTRNEDVASSITAATNRQTQISDDDLQALESFQKDLENYFAAHPTDQRLYYERRSKQYASSSALEKTRIITRPQLVKAYAAMFLDEPWRAGRYYRELQRLRKADIFSENDYPFAYYTSAVALYRLEYLEAYSYVAKK